MALNRLMSLINIIDWQDCGPTWFPRQTCGCVSCLCLIFHVDLQMIWCCSVCNVHAVAEMDTGLEDLELRESQREYLDFLDDDVNCFRLCLWLVCFVYTLSYTKSFVVYSKTRVFIMRRSGVWCPRASVALLLTLMICDEKVKKELKSEHYFKNE